MKWILPLVLLLAACSGTNRTGETFSEGDKQKLFDRSNEFFQANQLDSAAYFLDSLLNADSSFQGAATLRADIAWSKGNYPLALKTYTRLVKEDPQKPTIWARLGKIYLAQKDFRTAENAFSSIH